MKRSTTISRIYFIMITVIMLGACTRNNDASSGDIPGIATSGTWRVTLFTDSGNDETADFAGYSFSFNNNGTVAAVKNGITQNGTWSINNGSHKFNIDLGPKTDSNKPLGELTDDWLIIAVTNTEIKLTDDNAASNEYLTFTKN